MKCDRIEELLPDYVRGSLSGRKGRIVESHLQSCPRCRAAEQELEFIQKTLKKHSQDYVFSHVSPEELVDYVDGKEILRVEKQSDIESHLRVCALCKREADIIKKVNKTLYVRAWYGRLSDIVSRIKRMNSVRFRKYGVVIVSLGMALFLISRFMPRESLPGELPPPEFGERGFLNKELKLLRPAKEAMVTDPIPEFVWEPLPNVLHYNFTLYLENGDPVWKTKTKKSSLRLPWEYSLQDQQTYVWGVEGIVGPGITIESELFLFTTHFTNK